MSVDTALGLGLQAIAAIWQAAHDAASNKDNCRAMAQLVARLQPWLEHLQAQAAEDAALLELLQALSELLAGILDAVRRYGSQNHIVAMVRAAPAP